MRLSYATDVIREKIAGPPFLIGGETLDYEARHGLSPTIFVISIVITFILASSPRQPEVWDAQDRSARGHGAGLEGPTRQGGRGPSWAADRPGSKVLNLRRVQVWTVGQPRSTDGPRSPGAWLVRCSRYHLGILSIVIRITLGGTP